MRFPNHSKLLPLLLGLAVLGGILATPASSPAHPGHAYDPKARAVVLVSIDGLMPDYYLKADELGLKIPHLRRLMRDGVYARVRGVLPTVTYTSHTTLLTGVPPRLHGIVSNSVFDPEDQAGDAWNWFAEDIRVPTLVRGARENRIRAATVSWPVTIGIDADWNLPEFWRPGSNHPVDLKFLKQLSTPGLIDAVGEHRGKPFPWPLTEQERVDTAVYLLETQHPGLLLVHIFDLDFAQHRHGPKSPEALAAVEKSDAALGRLLAALGEQPGPTLFAVVSDHGFLPVSQAIQPNTLLREAGLLEVDDKGKVKTWKAFFQADGGSAALHLKDPADTATLSRVRQLLAPKLADPAAGIFQLLEPARIAELGGPPPDDVALVLDAREGFSFSDAVAGGWLTTPPYKGTHGHAPDRPELHAAFVMTAPGLTRKGDLGVIPMTSVAPTVAQFLKIRLSPQAGPPLQVW